MANRFFDKIRPRRRSGHDGYYGRPSLFQRLQSLPRRILHFMKLEGSVHLLWGFNHAWEFWFCALPAGSMALYGMITKQVGWIFYGLIWFFGFLALFVLTDIIRTYFNKPRD